MSTLNLSRVLADRLREAGVTRVFGFPGGGSNLALIETLRDAKVEFVLTRTETGAAHMACATAEMTGAPGVVLVGNGPGLTSVVNGVANAYLDRIPLIVISDRFTDDERTTTGHQILPQSRLLEPLVKGTATLGLDECATIDALINACCSAPSGPVHLEMPRGSGNLASDPIMRSAERMPAPGVRREDLTSIATALSNARRPVVLVGLESALLCSPTRLDALSDILRAPVFTTYKAKGCTRETGRWWAGILTGSEIETPVIEQADAIFTIGLDPVELLTREWRYRASVMSIRTCEVGQDYFGAGHTLVMRNLDEGLVGIVDRLREFDHRGASEWTEAEVASYRSAWQRELRLSGDGELMGWEVVDAVRAATPNDAVVCVDAGAHMFPATSFWTTHRPRSFLISNGLATMGFAVPAAVGAALTRPDRTAIALTGDGGMAYHAAELETARRTGARVVVVVFNDSNLSLIRIKHEATGGSRESLEFGDVRFADWASGLGAHGCRVRNAADLGREVSQALTRAESTVIDVQLLGREYGETLRLIRG